MTNGEKFLTERERSDAFAEYRNKYRVCTGCPLYHEGCDEDGTCVLAWLEMEYELNIDPCPFCGGKCELRTWGPFGNWTAHQVYCRHCEYNSRDYNAAEEAIDAHNRVARAVRAAKGEAK